MINLLHDLTHTHIQMTHPERFPDVVVEFCTPRFLGRWRLDVIFPDRVFIFLGKETVIRMGEQISKAQDESDVRQIMTDNLKHMQTFLLRD